jgi:hypothetical protein
MVAFEPLWKFPKPFLKFFFPLFLIGLKNSKNYSFSLHAQHASAFC